MSPGEAPPAFLDVPPLSGPARVAVLPFGYEATVSYGGGTADGPAALLEASAQVELYDERLRREVHSIGIETLPPPGIPEAPEDAVDCLQTCVAGILARNALPVVIGGEHSISLGVYRALAERHTDLGVVQLDAHADLRESYGGTPYSHACVMARIREHTDAVLQLGVRSLSAGEARRIKRDGCVVGFLHEMRAGRFDAARALDRLPENVFLTFDVDALDLSLMRATGTPEPGGFGWEEVNDLLALLFRRKTVVGFDVVELCGGDPVSAFTAARLVARMIGLRFAADLGPDDHA